MTTDQFPRLNLPPAQLSVRRGEQRDVVLCLSRRRYVALTPEEWVRQHFLAYMAGTLGFPASLLAVETPVVIGTSRQRADIVAFSRSMEPLVIVECKAPDVPLSQKTLNQACRYLSVLGARAVVLTNGLAHYCVLMSADGTPQFSNAMPTWETINN